MSLGTNTDTPLPSCLF